MEEIQTIEKILTLLDNLQKNSEQLPPTTLESTYQKLFTASKSHPTLSPNLKVKLNQHLDTLLEDIIDKIPFNITKPQGIYTPALQNYRHWKNVELLKDKGLVGYTLAKELGGQANMLFCSKPTDYPYASSLPDLKLHYHSTKIDIHLIEDFLIKHHKNMDVVILHGMFPEGFAFLKRYRLYRPDGIVFCGLDMNKHHMTRLPWDLEQIQDFIKNCNLIATSCRQIRDELNAIPNANLHCRFFPNGFFQESQHYSSPKPQLKENTILTVGRIGSKQKNNEELIQAFLQIHKKIPDWKLKLIGSVEPHFQEYLQQIVEKNPDLKEKIILTGSITDKNLLYKEYAKAKLFVLTSTFEGGAPNVYAEALFHGCKFITSQIDAAYDITNHGELGLVYQQQDDKALSNALLTLCHASSEKEMAEHIPKALAYGNRYYNWERNAKKLAYNLFLTS